MSYGTPKWQGWVLEEEEAIKHIKAACVNLSMALIYKLICYIPVMMLESKRSTPPTCVLYPIGMALVLTTT
jgi:hypothetical protein